MAVLRQINWQNLKEIFINWIWTQRIQYLDPESVSNFDE